MAKRNKEKRTRLEKRTKLFMSIFTVVAIVMVLTLFAALIITVLDMPPIGEADNPVNNIVSQKYIEDGIKDTGAVNIVSGMILDYRAFDTFGESCVLFIATICVTILLRLEEKNKTRSYVREHDRHFEPKHDTILQNVTFILFPVIMVFGIYIILNGHLSPGGGFSGGAALGAGFILYLNAYGFQKTERFMNAKSVKWITFCSLMVYCLAKSYSFFTGANHLHSVIPLGTPGNILSSGLILILNICVGLVVTCTMYSFYALVRRGKI